MVAKMAAMVTGNDHTKRTNLRNVITVTHDFNFYEYADVKLKETECFQIDEDDFRVLDHIFELQLEQKKDDEQRDWGIFLNRRSMISNWDDDYVYRRWIHNDKERRIYGLCVPKLHEPLPRSILRLDALEILDLRHLQSEIPRWIEGLTTLREIRLPNDCDLQNTPADGLQKLPTLEILRYSGWQQTPLPSFVGNFVNLKELWVNVTSLPYEIGNLNSLEILKQTGNEMRSLPSSIGKLVNLKELKVSVASLPDETGHLISLEILDLHGPGIVSLPTSIGKLTNLKKFFISGAEKLVDLPDSIGNLTSLETLSVSNSGISSLPESIGNLRNLKELFVESFGLLNTNIGALTNFPDSAGALINLEELLLTGSGLASLPDPICDLNLKKLHLNRTVKLNRLPDNFENLTRLEYLDLSWSGIVSHTETKPLESTNEVHGLSGNFSTLKLSELFERLKTLKNLKVLNLGGTIFESNFSGQEMLLKLALQLPLLGCMGYKRQYAIGNAEDLAIVRALSANRARYRIFHSKAYPDAVSPLSSLWPLILKNAKSASAMYPICDWCHDGCSCELMRDQSDTIFQLLVEYGSTFLYRAPDSSSNR